MKRTRSEFEADQGGSSAAAAQSLARMASQVVPVLLGDNAANTTSLFGSDDPASVKNIKAKQDAVISSIVASMAASGASVVRAAHAAEAAAAAQSRTGSGGSGEPSAPPLIGGNPRAIFPRGAFAGQPASVVAARQALEKEVEVDEHTVRKRREQLELGKNTLGYMRSRLLFSSASLPLSQRPRTPDPTERMSKRRWDSIIRSWRRHLHYFDLDTPLSSASASASASASGQQRQGGGMPAIAEEGGGANPGHESSSSATEGALEPLPDSIKRGFIGQGISHTPKDIPASGRDFLAVMWGNNWQEEMKKRGFDEKKGTLVVVTAPISASSSAAAAQARPVAFPFPFPASKGVFVPSAGVDDLLAAYLNGSGNGKSNGKD